jgi:hypothetical protein
VALSEREEFVFQLLVDAAVEGKRCPVADAIDRAMSLAGHGYGATLVPALADAGRIRIEVGGKNWRVVTICDGPHAGAATARPPGGRSFEPYVVIEPGGRRSYPKRAADRARRRA